MTDTDSTDDKPSGRPFWTSLGGVLTGVAGVVSALAAVLALVITGNTPEKRGPGSPPGSDAVIVNAMSSTTSTTQAELVRWAEQANAICKDAASDITAQGGADTPEQLAAAIPRARQASEQLIAVSRPAGARDRIARMIDLYEGSYDAIELALTAKQTGNDQAAREAVSRAEELSAQADSLATELGAVACVESRAQGG